MGSSLERNIGWVRTIEIRDRGSAGKFHGESVDHGSSGFVIDTGNPLASFLLGEINAAILQSGQDSIARVVPGAVCAG